MFFGLPNWGGGVSKAYDLPGAANRSKGSNRYIQSIAACLLVVLESNKANLQTYFVL